MTVAKQHNLENKRFVCFYEAIIPFHKNGNFIAIRLTWWTIYMNEQNGDAYGMLLRLLWIEFIDAIVIFLACLNIKFSLK